MDLYEADLSLRSFRVLRKAGYDTLESLTRSTRKELLSIYAFGRGCLAEVEAKLAEHGLTLRREPQPEKPTAPPPLLYRCAFAGCGREFQPRRRDARFCSRRCYQTDYDQRRPRKPAA